MDLDITLKNYRCFASANPSRFVMKDGFTAFVGLNNAGKSTILRFLYEFRSLFDQCDNLNFVRPLLAGSPQQISFQSHITDATEVFNNLEKGPIEIEVSGRRSKPVAAGTNYDRIKIVFSIPWGTATATGKLYIDGRLVSIDPGRGPLFDQSSAPWDIDEFRGALKSLASTLYVGAFRNAINQGEAADYFDIACGTRFITYWNQLQSGNNRAANEAASELVDGLTRILGFRSLQILPTADQKTLQFMIDGKSFRLTEVGAGLAQFVMVFASAAFRKPDFILIDEPELSLHPTLQLDFLTTLGSFAKRGVLYSTHSYGLARAVSDQLYTVIRLEQGRSQVRPWEQTPNLAELLGSLNYSGYQQLGFNKVLLVEGTTEVRTVQQFLRFYRKEHEVVLIPLGGASMIKGGVVPELEELKRITPNVFALIDSEKPAAEAPLESSRVAFQNDCKAANVRCHVLSYRAIENYLTEAAIQAVKGPKYAALGPYQARTRDAWAKSENWMIARRMSKADIDSTDLGKFLQEL